MHETQVSPPPPGHSAGGRRAFPDARTLRRRRMQQRQTVIFGSLLLIMCVLLVFSIPFATGWVSLPFGNEFSAGAAAKAGLPPCSPTGDPLALNKVSVEIYNGSSQSGLAGGTGEELAKYGVKVAKVGNNPQPFSGGVRLKAGPKGVAAAYSVGRFFPGAEVTLIERQDATVEIVLGENFGGTLAGAGRAESELGAISAVSENCQRPEDYS